MKRSRAGERGAVMAELVIALVPLLTTFFSIAQIVELEKAKLLLRHGAICGARAAAVTSNVYGNNPGAPAIKGDPMPRRAVEQALAPFLARRAMTDLSVEVTDASSLDPSAPVRVRVTAKVECAVPMMGRVLCKGSHETLEVEAAMPHQGALYADE